MKKRFFAITCIIFHIAFAFFQIYKQTTLIKLSYKKQKEQALLNELKRQKALLMHTFEELKNRSALKEYALKELGMEKLRLESIERISYDNN